MEDHQIKLCKQFNGEAEAFFNKHGFVKEEYVEEGFESYGTLDYTLETKNFRIVVDVYFEVRLQRRDIETDSLILPLSTVSELTELIDFCAD